MQKNALASNMDRRRRRTTLLAAFICSSISLNANASTMHLYNCANIDGQVLRVSDDEVPPNFTNSQLKLLRWYTNHYTSLHPPFLVLNTNDPTFDTNSNDSTTVILLTNGICDFPCTGVALFKGKDGGFHSINLLYGRQIPGEHTNTITDGFRKKAM